MSVYKSFAVVGGGHIGLPILTALAANNAAVILLSRPGASTKTGIPSGVPVVQVDFSDAAAVAAVLKEHNVDVVVSTISGTAIMAQKPLVDAAKLAGVKLFVPSEYGMASDAHTAEVLGGQNTIAAYLKSAGIPSTRIYVGLFTEFIPWLFEDGKLKVIRGKGDIPVSFTSIPDISGFVAHVLTTVPPSELEDRTLRLEGERFSFNGLAAQFTNISVEHVDSIAGEGADFKALLLQALATGPGSSGWDGARKAEGTGSNAAGSANALWPGHQWQTIKQVHKL
ncbi:hypothetical protein B0H14DRAFT_2521781 [Mycena olivaceomarginata]|nr:hypothetical protein B0H14DRAFT_2521781 [Mycena olivaceomarginata]